MKKAAISFALIIIFMNANATGSKSKQCIGTQTNNNRITLKNIQCNMQPLLRND